MRKYIPLFILSLVSIGDAAAQGPKTVPNDIIGKVRPLVMAELDALGIRYELRYRKVCDLGDVVISSNPLPGAPLDTNDPVVFLEINAGDGTAPVPSAVGKTMAEVAQLFSDSCLKLAEQLVLPPEDDWCSVWRPTGGANPRIARTLPRAATVVQVNSTVVAQRELNGHWRSQRINGICP